jgi:hypothetical protein
MLQIIRQSIFKRGINDSDAFEVLAAMVMKSTTFWDTTPCSLLKSAKLFGRIYRLHLQQSLLATCFQAGSLHVLFFDPENGGDLTPKRRLTFSVLHGVIPLIIVLSIREWAHQNLCCMHVNFLILKVSA